MPPPEPLPAALVGRPFSVTEGRALGIGLARLRRSDLVTPHWGVRAWSAGVALDDRCRALAPALGHGTAFSHLTAMALWGLPLPRGHDPARGPLHVVSPRGRRVRRPGVVGHTATAARLGPSVDLRGLPVVDPVTAWSQSAASMTLDDVVTIADALMGRWSTHPQARELDREVLSSAIRAGGRRRGATTARSALELAVPNVWSPRETDLRLLLVRAGITGLSVNEPVHDSDGRLIGYVDVAHLGAKVALEYQGDHHRTDRFTYRDDIRRREAFEDAGWRQVQATDDDLGPLADAFVARVRRLITKRGVDES